MMVMVLVIFLESLNDMIIFHFEIQETMTVFLVQIMDDYGTSGHIASSFRFQNNHYDLYPRCKPWCWHIYLHLSHVNAPCFAAIEIFQHHVRISNSTHPAAQRNFWMHRFSRGCGGAKALGIPTAFGRAKCQDGASAQLELEDGNE